MQNRCFNKGRGSVQAGFDMWVSKPIYESLPYFYLAVGGISLAASMYLNHWHWPTICFVVGLACLVGGLVLLLKRRDYRHTESRNKSNPGADP